MDEMLTKEEPAVEDLVLVPSEGFLGYMPIGNTEPCEKVIRQALRFAVLHALDDDDDTGDPELFVAKVEETLFGGGEVPSGHTPGAVFDLRALLHYQELVRRILHHLEGDPEDHRAVVTLGQGQLCLDLQCRNPEHAPHPQTTH